MKTRLTQLIKKCAIISFGCYAGIAQAATFTAVSSGSWSSTSTWSGGIAPGGTISGIDNVVINPGVTVSMDMNVTVSGLVSYVQVNGTLNSSSSAQTLNINNGNLSGNGTINLHKLRLGTLGGMSFTGTANIDNLWNNNLSLSLANHLNINDTLFLESGNLTMGSGGMITLQTNSVVHVDDGSITLGSGVINNSNDYTVIYVGSSKTAGLELTGAGLTDVWVNLDDNTQSLSIAGSMTVHGNLHHNTGSVNINGGTLILMEDYMRAPGAQLRGSSTSNLLLMHAGTLSSSLMFNTTADQLNDLWVKNASGSVSLASDLTINGTLTAEDGDFIVTAGILTMANGSDITIGDGHLVLSGGSFDGTNDYNLTYNGSASTQTAVELTGTGLGNLTVQLDDASDSVEIMNHLTVGGVLNLENGSLAMNGYNVTLNGNFASTATGYINGDPGSNLSIIAATAPNDTMRFRAGDSQIEDLLINTTTGGYLILGSDLSVENLALSNGGVMILDNDLWINSTGTITGADEDSYVMIDGNGHLNMRVNVSSPYLMFPVGTDESYAPVGVRQNTGTPRYFRVNTRNGVWSSGTTGTDNSLTESVVNRTWNVSPAVSGSINIDIVTEWDGAMEVNGFDRTDAYISRYGSSVWDTYATGSAVPIAGGRYQMERENITASGPFAVVDEAASVEVAEINDEPLLQMYPNPVHDVLTCVVNIRETTTVDLVNLTGQVLYSRRLEGTAQTMSHSIDFSALPRGVYFIRYNSPSRTTSYKIVKS